MTGLGEGDLEHADGGGGQCSRGGDAGRGLSLANGAATGPSMALPGQK